MAGFLYFRFSLPCSAPAIDANSAISVRNLQAELVRPETLAALGALVAGMAHELNTPIGNGPIASSTLAGELDAFDHIVQQQFSRRDLLRQLEVLRHGTNLVVRNLQRAGTLITSFKQVAVDQTSEQRRRLHLAELVDEVRITLEPTYRGRCQFHLDVNVALQLDTDAGALVQTLTNLVANSVLHGFAGRDNGNNLINDLLHGEIAIASTPGQGTEVTLRFLRVGPASRQRIASAALGPPRPHRRCGRRL